MFRECASPTGQSSPAKMVIGVCQLSEHSQSRQVRRGGALGERELLALSLVVDGQLMFGNSLGCTSGSV